jgi:hypothetical protein
VKIVQQTKPERTPKKQAAEENTKQRGKQTKFQETIKKGKSGFLMISTKHTRLLKSNVAQ